MPEGRVCCCGLYTWTKTIAWLDFVVASMGVIAMFLILIFVEDQSLASYFPLDIHNSTHRLLIFLLLSDILCFAKGIMLFKGISQGSPKYLMIWTILTVVWLIMSVIYKLMTMKVVLVAMEIVIIFIVIGFTSFVIWIVQIYRIDIKLSQHDHDVVRVLYK